MTTRPPMSASDALDALARARVEATGEDYAEAFKYVLRDPLNRSIVDAYNRAPHTEVPGGYDEALRNIDVVNGLDDGLTRDKINIVLSQSTESTAGDQLDKLTLARVKADGGDYRETFDQVCADNPVLANAYHGNHAKQVAVREPTLKLGQRLTPAQAARADAQGLATVHKMGPASAGGGIFLAAGA